MRVLKTKQKRNTYIFVALLDVPVQLVVVYLSCAVTDGATQPVLHHLIYPWRAEPEALSSGTGRPEPG